MPVAPCRGYSGIGRPKRPLLFLPEQGPCDDSAQGFPAPAHAGAAFFLPGPPAPSCNREWLDYHRASP